MTTRPHLTTKQQQILAVIRAGDTSEGARVPLDIDQILDLLPYETTKQSFHFSLRALINRGMLQKLTLEKRRGRRRVLIDLDVGGLAYFGAPRGLGITSDEDADELDE